MTNIPDHNSDYLLFDFIANIRSTQLWQIPSYKWIYISAHNSL